MLEFKEIWNKTKLPLFMLIGALLFGVVGYHIIYPDVPLEKVLFMTGITLSTVGYSDVLNVEGSLIGIIFTMTLMMVGMGIVLYAVSNVTAFFVEGNLKNIFIQEKTKRRAKKMNDHYIICGAGRTGIHVIREMHQTKQKFIVIDSDEKSRERITEEFPEAIVIIGDVTDDQTLMEANIEKAKGLVVSLSNDKDNLYLVVTAKMINPNITIVARAVDLTISDKLKKAGANYVVSPNFIGGMRIASEILRPNVVSFLDKMLRGTDQAIRVEEFVIPEGHHHNGKSLNDLEFFNNTGVNILAFSKDGTCFTYNPSPDLIVDSGNVLLFIATNEQRKSIEDMYQEVAILKLVD